MITYLFLITFCLNGFLQAQNASDYMPVLNSSWTLESISTLDDTTLLFSTRDDTLISIESEGAYSVYSIRTSENFTYFQDTRDDTLYIRLSRILGSEIFDEDLIELDVDPEERLPIAIFSTEVDDEWEIYYLEQMIELTDSIKAVIPDDIQIDDEADIEIRVTGRRGTDEILALPIGDISTYVFDSMVDVVLTVYVRPFGSPVPVPVEMIDDFTVRTHIAHELGIVQQSNDEYDVIASYDSQFFGFSEYLFTIPANNTRMVAFTEGDPTFISDDTQHTPEQFTLYQNYPNPFNPVTTITYSLSEQSHVTLTVYNILGSEVGTLVNEQHVPGTYSVTFDAMDLPSGIYFYTLQAGSFSETKRMVLTK